VYDAVFFSTEIMSDNEGDEKLYITMGKLRMDQIGKTLELYFLYIYLLNVTTCFIDFTMTTLKFKLNTDKCMNWFKPSDSSVDMLCKVKSI